MTILFSLYIANDKINKINAFPTESFIRIPLLLQTLKWNYVTFLLWQAYLTKSMPFIAINGNTLLHAVASLRLSIIATM